MSFKILLFLIVITTILTSCEGFKGLSISNSTDENTHFIIEQISQDYYHNLYSQNIKPEKTFDIQTITIRPNTDTFIFVTSIVPMIYGNKLIPPDLNIRKLYIIQGIDSIKFENEDEIINALKGKEYTTKTFRIKTKRKNNTILIK